MPVQTGKSRILRLRNKNQTSADNQTNRNTRAATNNNNADDAESNNNNNNVTGRNDVNSADEVAKECTNEVSDNNENNDNGGEEYKDNDVRSEEIDCSITVTVGALGKTFSAPDE